LTSRGVREYAYSEKRAFIHVASHELIAQSIAANKL